MKKYIPLLMIISILFSCKKDENKKEISIVESTAIETNDFIKTFEGKIGEKYNIVLKITSNKNIISGGYYYPNIGGELKLKGTIDNTGKVIMKEFDKSGNQTGVFEGIFSKNRIDGKWEKPNGSQAMQFYLIESNILYSVTEKKANSKKNKISFPPSNFKGHWSNSLSVNNDSELHIEIDQIGDSISGTIEYKTWDKLGEITSKSGLCSIIGKVNGGTAKIEVYSPKGIHYKSFNVKLIKEGDYIKFISNSERDDFFPKEILIWR